jgi:glycosyltransferase involved in cell wall biosynthesis
MEASRFVVIPNGIELEPWASAQPLPRASLGIEEDAMLAGCVGRLDEAKGHDLLLEAAARVAHPRLRLVIAGDGPQRAALEARARDLNLDRVVRWLGWREDVPRLLKTLQVFAMPSRYEGHSVALLEAMASGCACLVSDIPELRELLGDAGLHAARGDAGALAAGLRRLLDDAALRQRYGREAQRRAQGYSIDASARRYLQLYEEVLGSTAPRGGPR